ncbi:MAG: peptidase domain-containing ABC transporter [Pseudomonadota bacterium]
MSSMNLAAADFTWLLGSLCQLSRIPFDAGLVTQEFPPPHTLPSLLESLQKLGFDVGTKAVRSGRLPRLPVPFVALMTDAADPKLFRPALVVRAEGDRVLYFAAGSHAPVQATLDEFAAGYTGRVLQYRREEEAPGDPDAVAATGQGFGFRWFVPVLLKHKAMWREVLLASLVLQLIGLATPLFTQVIIDKVIVHQTVSTLIVIGVALFVFMLFSALLTWMRQHLLLLVGNRVDAVLGTAVFEHLFRLPLRYFEHRPTGVIAARLHAVETIREFLAGTIVTLLLDLPFLVIFIAMMFWYSASLTLIVLAVLGAVVVTSLVIAPLFQKLLNRQFMVGARNQAFLTEYVAGMETVKSLQLEPQLRDRYRDYFGEYLEAARATRQLGNTYNVITNTLQQLMTLLVLIIGAWIVMTGTTLTIGMLVAFQMFAGKLSQPLMGLVGLWQQFQQAKISVERLGDLMNVPAEPYTLTPSRETVSKGEVEFSELGFRYGDDRPFLYRNFSLRIPPGSTFAVMGPSGSGKSTLAKLLMGFLQPVEGSVKVDGRDVRHLAANELRTAFGVVPQETTLFSGTVLENLMMANPNAAFEDVVAACRMAEMHDVIERLPKGYQTPLGERGIGLSGGQRQRLSIARALLKRPPILILDEAVSNLDEHTAEHFCKTLNQLRGKVTMIFITHQLPKTLQVDGVIRIGTPALVGAPSGAANPAPARDGQTP